MCTICRSTSARRSPTLSLSARHFRRTDYFTARVGKIYHYGVPKQIGTAGLDDPPSWNLAVNPAGVDHTKRRAAADQLHTGSRHRLGCLLPFIGRERRGAHRRNHGRTNQRTAQRTRKGPFFLAAGFYRPHVPWIAPSKYFDMFPLRNIELTPFDQSEMSIAPDLAYWVRPANWNMTAAQMKERCGRTMPRSRFSMRRSAR